MYRKVHKVTRFTLGELSHGGFSGGSVVKMLRLRCRQYLSVVQCLRIRSPVQGTQV